ncbi:hypothetical protein [Streptomyces mirabilis]
MHGTTQVTTHVTVRGDLDPAHFRSGAERWAAELPLLSLRIEERPDGLWFTTGPGPRPGQIRHDPPGTPVSADDVLRGELNDVLETGGPLWRLRLVRDPGARASHLYFTRNHAISDGHSTGAVVRALLDALFAPTDGVSVHDVRTQPPNGDALTYRPPARPDTPVREFVPRPDPLPFAAHRPWDERAAVFVPLAFTREESLALKS